MKKLNSTEVKQIQWHLLNNVLPALSDKTIAHIIKDINALRTGKKFLDDTLPDNRTTYAEMIEDLKLENYVEELLQEERQN